MENRMLAHDWIRLEAAQERVALAQWEGYAPDQEDLDLIESYYTPTEG